MTSESSSTAVTRDYGKRTVIVTGGAQGMSVSLQLVLCSSNMPLSIRFPDTTSGRAIALRLANDGFSVCVNDVAANRANVEKVVQEIQDIPGRKAYGHIADVSRLEEVEKMIDTSVEVLGPLNVMVANAGIAQVKPALDLTPSDLEKMFQVNVFGLFNCYQAAAKQMIKQGGGGQIIGAASIVSFKPFALLTHYSASKYAVRGFTIGLAMELAEHKITVNAYAPGVVGTGMWDLIDQELSKSQGAERGSVFKGMDKNILLGRTSTPEDVAKTVSFLASPDALYMTGQTLVVDGGMVFA